MVATGIKSLKVRLNSVFGYFIEITKSNLAMCRRTTLASKRLWWRALHHARLKEMEAKILGADERARNLEYPLFQKLREETLPELGPFKKRPPRLRTRRHSRAGGDGASLPPRRRAHEALSLKMGDGRHPVPTKI